MVYAIGFGLSQLVFCCCLFWFVHFSRGLQQKQVCAAISRVVKLDQADLFFPGKSVLFSMYPFLWAKVHRSPCTYHLGHATSFWWGHTRSLATFSRHVATFFQLGRSPEQREHTPLRERALCDIIFPCFGGARYKPSLVASDEGPGSNCDARVANNGALNGDAASNLRALFG